MAIEVRPRCWWSGAESERPDPLMVAYHDDEWGVPVESDSELFERFALESFQAGLSWSTILRKREGFRLAFEGFDPAVVARYGPDERDRLMANAAIVRNGEKIDATIGNAVAPSAISVEAGRASRRDAGGSPPRRPETQPGDIPA
jgi:DNA-3-methyladenine glycosylase I